LTGEDFGKEGHYVIESVCRDKKNKIDKKGY